MALAGTALIVTAAELDDPFETTPTAAVHIETTEMAAVAATKRRRPSWLGRLGFTFEISA
ncbi:MAG: hypothetical protein ACRDV3_11660 [Acidothermaceae bacterium]